MEDKIQTLTKYRFEKAREDLKASINRSYYAIFHAIRAVNAIDEFDSKKHSGVIAHFNQFFIHTGKFEKEIYSIIISAYKIRKNLITMISILHLVKKLKNNLKMQKCF